MPKTLTTSLSRPTRCTRPAGATTPRAPVWNQPFRIDDVSIPVGVRYPAIIEGDLTATWPIPGFHPDESGIGRISTETRRIFGPTDPGAASAGASTSTQIPPVSVLP